MGKNTLKLDVKGFAEYLEKLDRLGADIKPLTEKALTKAGDKIAQDTHAAVQDGNLPAGGKYSDGDTDASIVDNPRVEWSGTIAEIGVGFDYNKPGAGGYLITGTPKMRPDKALNKMYKGKKYMSDIQKDMGEVFSKELAKRMEG